MKVCAAQLRPAPGNIDGNIVKHTELIELAASLGSSIVVFPELSLSGYEPTLAHDLATTIDDPRLGIFQSLANSRNITIGLGIPIKSRTGILIGEIFFQPNCSRLAYFKQHLHQDEFPYFEEGTSHVMLDLNGYKIAPAICYESLLPQHSESAFSRGANIYFASVAKSQRGVEKAVPHFTSIATEYSMAVLMSNCTGHCDNFLAVGQSSIWNKKGQLLGQLRESDEGILLADLKTEEVTVRLLAQ